MGGVVREKKDLEIVKMQLMVLKFDGEVLIGVENGFCIV